MPDGHHDLQSLNIHNRHDGLPLSKEVSSQALVPIIVGDLNVHALQVPQTISPTLKLEAGPSQNHIPPLDLKQVENLIGIFDDERGGSLAFSPRALFIQRRIPIFAPV